MREKAWTAMMTVIEMSVVRVSLQRIIDVVTCPNITIGL